MAATLSTRWALRLQCCSTKTSIWYSTTCLLVARVVTVATSLATACASSLHGPHHTTNHTCQCYYSRLKCTHQLIKCINCSNTIGQKSSYHACPAHVERQLLVWPNDSLALQAWEFCCTIVFVACVEKRWTCIFKGTLRVVVFTSASFIDMNYFVTGCLVGCS